MRRSSLGKGSVRGIMQPESLLSKKARKLVQHVSDKTLVRRPCLFVVCNCPWYRSIFAFCDGAFRGEENMEPVNGTS